MIAGSSPNRGQIEDKGGRLLFARWRCIQIRMHSILTVRLPSELLARLDKKAAALGRPRAEHVRQVIEADLKTSDPKSKRFACLPLAGRYSLGRGSDNAAVRRAFREAYEKDR